MEKRLREAEAALAVCRQTIDEMGQVVDDPTMPLLVPEVLKALQETAEVQYALAENTKERIEAHGLDLLCKWQVQARRSRGKDA